MLTGCRVGAVTGIASARIQGMQTHPTVAVFERVEVGLSDFKYKRVLLKLSGEALMGSQSFGIDPAVPLRLAEEIRPVYEAGVEVAVVAVASMTLRSRLSTSLYVMVSNFLASGFLRGSES